MKNLGRALLFLLLSTQILFAVTAKISPSVVYEGDRISLILTANGSDVKFPDIEKIDRYEILAKSSSSNITNINGNISRSLSKEYTFVADNNFTVQSFEVIIDGDIEKTKSFDVEVRKQKIGKQEAFSFELVADKSEAYIGENVNVDFIFKQHIDVDLAEANFNSPSFANFWAKPLGKVPPTIEGDYKVHKIRYILFPQKSGDIEIEAGRIDAGIMQTQKRGFFQARNVKWKSLYTKGLTIKVKPLPAGVDIYGNFKFDVTVDKTNTKANEPINLTVVIKGIGNIDDIDDFKIDIKDAIVYADKPEKKIYTNNKEELGEFVQKFAIVSDRNFTIEPLEFKFFNSVDKKTTILKSKKYDITVQGNLIKTQTAQLQKKEPEYKTETKVERVYDKASKTTIILFTFGGFLAGFMTAFLLGFSFKSKKNDHTQTPLVTKIKKSKSDKELLSLLLSHSNKTDKMRELIKRLEENVYEGKNHKIDKKELIKNLSFYLKQEKKVNEILN